MGISEDIVVSIVIPVYQVRDTVRECVNSCLSQKGIEPEKIEVVLVDDGSTDGSGEICDELAREDADSCCKEKPGMEEEDRRSDKVTAVNDPDICSDEREAGNDTGSRRDGRRGRIRVLHTKNSGVSHARNVGIEEASGKYLVFVDSDDVVKDGFLKRLLDACDEDTNLVDETDSLRAQKRVSGFYYIENSVLNKNSHVWGKLFSGDVIRENNLRFSEDLTIGEDLIFLLDFALLQGKRHSIRCIPAGDYVYRENEQGAMKGAFRESYLDEIKCWRMAEERLLPYSRNISGYAFVSIAVSQILTAFLVAGKVAALDDNTIDLRLKKRAIAEVDEQIRHGLKTRGAFAALPLGHKIKTVVFKLSSELYLKLYGVRVKI